MPNGLVKLIWAIIALTAFFASEYFGVRWPYAIVVFALYRFAVVEVVECCVAGTMAALEVYDGEQARIEYAEEKQVAEQRQTAEHTILNSNLFRDRLHRLGDDE